MHTYFVHILLQARGIEQTTESNLDPFAENLAVSQSQTSKVIHLGLEECIVVKGVLGSYLNSDARVSCFVPGSFSTCFDLLVDFMVVRGREEGELIGTEELHGVEGCDIAERCRVLCDLSIRDIISGFSTSKISI